MESLKCMIFFKIESLVTSYKVIHLQDVELHALDFFCKYNRICIRDFHRYVENVFVCYKLQRETL